MTKPDNNKPVPIRLGDKKPELQSIANEKKWSLHFLVNELLDVSNDCLRQDKNVLTYSQEIDNNIVNGYVLKKEELLMKSFEPYGVNKENMKDFKGRIECVTRINDPYEHWYFTTNECVRLRVISIEKPQFSYSSNEATVSSKYY